MSVRGFAAKKVDKENEKSNGNILRTIIKSVAARFAAATGSEESESHTTGVEEKQESLTTEKLAATSKTTKTIYYKTTVGNEECRVSDIDADEEWNLKNLKAHLFEVNEMDLKSTVKFYESGERVVLTTRLRDILPTNSKENPLVVKIDDDQQQQQNGPLVRPTQTSDVEWSLLVRQPNVREDNRLFARKDAKEKVIQYLQGCSDRTQDCYVEGKFSMLGTSGVKGIGKTQLQAQICAKWAIEALGENTKTLYVTYNGWGTAGAYCSKLENMATPIINSFGHLLLVSSGMKEEDAIRFKIDEAIACIREKMQCKDDACLVICVDEIIELDIKNKQGNGSTEMTLAQEMMSRCMQFQDASEGKVIFIFSAILDSMLTSLESMSGREVQTVPLDMIPLQSVFSDLLSEKLKALARKQPAVHQLVLSCAGHPRATVDGLSVATEEWKVGRTVSQVNIINARQRVVRKCKFNISYLNEQIIQEWFSPVDLVSEELRRYLLEKGILHLVGGGVEFLFPLLVQEWAYKNQEHPYGYHLKELFQADQMVGQDTEKYMENIMYHYEAVLRKSLENKIFSLQSFYKSKYIGEFLADRRVTVDIPGGERSLVAIVTDFSNSKHIRRLLEDGFIVVSEKHRETGIEYLAPYRDGSNALLVACVQCKFVKKDPKWSKIRSKMSVAVEWLDKENIEHFPVIYTTADQRTVQENTYKDGVYLIETDIFTFTKRLGILRLHTQKLGLKLKEEYSFLNSVIDLPPTQ